MSTYKGKSVTVNHPAQAVFDKISNLSSFQQRLDEMPDEVKNRLGDVKFEADKIRINAPGVGELVFKVVERISPNLVKLSAENSPVPFMISMKLDPIDEQTTSVATELDVEVPMMLRPLIGGKMQEAADKFSEMFSGFFGA